jgi:hypothetical protein
MNVDLLALCGPIRTFPGAHVGALAYLEPRLRRPVLPLFFNQTLSISHSLRSPVLGAALLHCTSAICSLGSVFAYLFLLCAVTRSVAITSINSTISARLG